MSVPCRWYNQFLWTNAGIIRAHVSAILAHFFNPVLSPVNSENLLPERKNKFSEHFIYYVWREVSAEDVDDSGEDYSAIWNDEENEGRSNNNGDYEDGCDVKNKDNNKNYEILLMLTPAGCADNRDEGEEVNEGDEDNYDDAEEDCWKWRRW